MAAEAAMMALINSTRVPLRLWLAGSGCCRFSFPYMRLQVNPHQFGVMRRCSPRLASAKPPC